MSALERGSPVPVTTLRILSLPFSSGGSIASLIWASRATARNQEVLRRDSNTIAHDVVLQGLTFKYEGAMATSIKLDDELKNRVQHLAGLRQRTPHWIMREAIAQYVEREEKRESFRQEALASWKHYQETGLHLTLEDADDWLAKLEAGEEAEPPKCHV
jgi:predicted transcriptional regulator